ncbi:MAG: anthrone oxygenase family protein [Actinomycetota bacterium]
MKSHANDQPSFDRSRSRPAAVLHALSAALIVTNAAVYLFLAVAIVPYWQTLSGQAIQEWFDDHFGRFATMMVPVHVLAIATTLAAASFQRGRTGSGRVLWVVVVIGLLVSQAFNFTVFATSLNPDLSSTTLTASEALDTLDDWGTLHLVRTFFVVVSAAATTTLIAGGLTDREMAR